MTNNGLEYYKAIPVRSQFAVRDQDLVFNARHYMKYAGACFGTKVRAERERENMRGEERRVEERKVN